MESEETEEEEKQSIEGRERRYKECKKGTLFQVLT